MDKSEQSTDHSPQTKKYGIDYIKDYIKSLPLTPGVYQMLDTEKNVLYVGKAKSLKKRVASYTKVDNLSYRIARMVSLVRNISTINTHTEAEALLLESNLIKQLKPPFNILLKDDKSFPYILLTQDTKWPQLVKHRGSQSRSGSYYGPFSSTAAVHTALKTLQRAFPLRTCSDATFSSRKRPCLEYQIKRCLAPCVNYINKEEYQTIAHQAGTFLNGNNQNIKQELADEMLAASQEQKYEKAGSIRDRIHALSFILAKQDIHVNGFKSVDVLIAVQENDMICIQVIFYRHNQNLGQSNFFPKHTNNHTIEEVLSAFIGQFYAKHPPPEKVIINYKIPEIKLIENALNLRTKDHKVNLSSPQRGELRAFITRSAHNARHSLREHALKIASESHLLSALRDLFTIEKSIERIEVYDNSHIQGQHAIGAMIVAGVDGFIKSEYRKFNFPKDSVTQGDDYGMMKQMIIRRFGRLLKKDRTYDKWPDLVLIDGGRGQLSTVWQALKELEITDVPVVAISKGPDRNAGREKFHQIDKETFSLAPDTPALYYLQRLRDEAHRFAIGAHRAKRSKAIKSSAIDDIPSIGPKRKKILLHAFGDVKAIQNASIADLEAISGISKEISRQIYGYFHETD